MDNPFFTVIIPTYNRAQLIRRPIESVLRQTFLSWELIIVDDGSTDDTEKVVRSFSDSRIRYIFQKNQERSAARNTGIQNSAGRYICFIDSDDYYFPQHLESFHKKIEAEKFPVAVFYCDTVEDNDGKMIRAATPMIHARNNVEWVVQMTLGTPRTCTHHSILEKHRFNPSVTVGEDVDLWVRALKEYPVIYNNDCTVAFVSHAGRTVDISSEQGIKAHVSLMKKIISEDTDGYISRTVRRAILSNGWFRMGQHYVFSGKRAKAFFFFFRSLMIAPCIRTKEKIYLLLRQFFLTRMILSFIKRIL